MSTAKLEAVKAHPYHAYLGLKQFQSDNGQGRLELQVAEQHINPAGALHGGIIYSVLDVVAYIALLNQLPPTQEAVTHDIHISVMRAAKLGDQLEFSATVEKLGKNLAFIQVQASSNGKLIATARVTKSLISL
jgi:uncharacterized protein (TIGR00369 family)